MATGRDRVRRSLTDLEPGDPVVVALSGGADSLALAAVTAFVARKLCLTAEAVVVDHGLQDGSAEVAHAAARTATELGLQAQVLSVSVGTAGGPEAAARVARYAALSAAARDRNAAAVLLAHTRDDQAETVLLGLARGSGTRSLAAMAPADGLWRRPFLSLSRRDTEAICTASGLSWWDDAHNADPSYARVRVRSRVLPVLEAELGPGISEALSRTAQLARADADLLDTLAAEAAAAVAAPGGGLSVEALAAQPDALRTRIIRNAALAAGCTSTDLSLVHVQEVDRLVTDWHGQQRIELPSQVAAVRYAGVISFRSAPMDLSLPGS